MNMKYMIRWVIWFLISFAGLRQCSLLFTSTWYEGLFDRDTLFALNLLGFSILIATLITGIGYLGDKIDKK